MLTHNQKYICRNINVNKHVYTHSYVYMCWQLVLNNFKIPAFHTYPHFPLCSSHFIWSSLSEAELFFSLALSLVSWSNFTFVPLSSYRHLWTIFPLLGSSLDSFQGNGFWRSLGEWKKKWKLMKSLLSLLIGEIIVLLLLL